MECVIRAFRFMGDIWKARVEKAGSGKPGHRAYAIREREKWYGWAEIARSKFGKVAGEQMFVV